MKVGKEKKNKKNVILLTTGDIVSNDILEDLRSLEDVFSVRRIEL